jgi:hypothetical protein
MELSAQKLREANTTFETGITLLFLYFGADAVVKESLGHGKVNLFLKKKNIAVSYIVQLSFLLFHNEKLKKRGTHI